MKPIIGITSYTLNSFLPKLNKGNERQVKAYESIIEISPELKAIFDFNDQKLQFVFENDIKAIENAGGIPLLIPSFNDTDNMIAILDRLDGILIAGGYDIHPKYYNEDDLYSKGLLGDIETLSDDDASLFTKFSDRRDQCEIKLIQGAYAKGVPVLGICRGAQAVNVAMGGSIHQDIIKQNISNNDHSDIGNWNDFSHEIKIEKNSFLHTVLKKDQASVNSIHHQAIKKVGKNLKVTARAGDGIIECVESTDQHFLMGIQWHPEMLHHDEDSQNLLKAFINVCKD